MMITTTRANALIQTPIISQKCMEVSHHLPLDILRLLLEFSAATNLESARVLSLVSKDVQLWADPYVFQVVRGPRKNNSDESSSTLLARMCRSDASPRLVLARNYVHTAAWKENVKQKFYIKQALEHFPNMTQFCLWGNIFPFRPEHDTSNTRPFEITQGYPSVRRVATCILYQSTVPPNAFGSPFWMTITHLQVNYYAAVSSVGSPFYLPLFATMTSLTHLALPAFAGESEPNADLALSLVKETFPPSLILCLLSLVAPERVDRNNWLAGMITASRKIDERIVMWSFVPTDQADDIVVTNGGVTFEDWCEFRGRTQTYWEAGEMVLKRRHERVDAV